MEILKPSEEELIKLGKQIVEELQLDSSVNTLGRWMAHYVAELIDKTENSSSETEKRINQKECCEVIIKLWRNREHVPHISKPLSELEPFIALLDVLKDDRYSLPLWRHYRDIPDSPTWKGFMELVKKNSVDIFELCLYSTLNKEILEKEEKWTHEYKSLLKEDELHMFNHLNSLINRRKPIIIDFNKYEEEIELIAIPKKERYIVIFDKMESKLEELKSKLLLLKESVINTINSETK